MDVEPVLALLGVTLVCFALRAFPRIGKPLLGHDTWGILLVVDELKKGHGYDSVTRYFLVQGDHDYPPLFFYFLSLFPSSLLRKYNWLITPMLDTVNAAIVFVSAYLFTENITFGLIAGMIYAVTPVVVEESLVLSARAFGSILLNLTLLSFVLYQYSRNPVFILLMVASGILTLLSHKFATQVLYLLLVSFALIGWSYLPILVLAAIFAGAILLSGRFYVKVLRGHIALTWFWVRHHKFYGRDYLNRKSPDTKAESTLRVKKPEIEPTSLPRRLWSRTKRINPLYWLLRLNPFNPFALIIVLLPLTGIGQAWEWVLFQWSIVTLLLFYAAASLRFLGQHQGRFQYLDYNAFPTAILCALFVWKMFSFWKLFIIAITFLLAIIQIARSWTRIRKYSRADDQSLLEDIFEYLRKSPKDGVLCLPISHAYAIPYFTGKKVFHTLSAKNHEKLAAIFPTLTVSVPNLSDEYGISFILLDETIVPVNALDLPGFNRVMERNKYLLLEKSD